MPVALLLILEWSRNWQKKVAQPYLIIFYGAQKIGLIISKQYIKKGKKNSILLGKNLSLQDVMTSKRYKSQI